MAPKPTYIAYHRTGKRPRRIGATGHTDPVPGTLILIKGGNRTTGPKADLKLVKKAS